MIAVSVVGGDFLQPELLRKSLNAQVAMCGRGFGCGISKKNTGFPHRYNFIVVGIADFWYNSAPKTLKDVSTAGRHGESGTFELEKCVRM